MSQHDDQVHLKHMLDHAREAVEMVAGKAQADLVQNRMLELALTRLIEIIGEEDLPPLMTDLEKIIE